MWGLNLNGGAVILAVLTMCFSCPPPIFIQAVLKGQRPLNSKSEAMEALFLANDVSNLLFRLFQVYGSDATRRSRQSLRQRSHGRGKLFNMHS